MKELPKCQADGCEKNARSLKGGYCIMHYTRMRNYGDTSVNLYEDRGKRRLELPDGTIITEAKKIENLKIIIERIRNRRLLGHPTPYSSHNNDDTLDIIERVLDDHHGKYKGGRIRRGTKTLQYNRYLEDLVDSNQGFEQGLITIEQAGWISKIVSELCKAKEPIRLEKACEDLGIKYGKEWLIKAFTKHPIIGITYNSKEKTIEFSKDNSWFYEEFKKNPTDSYDNYISAGLHYERIWSYEEYASSKTT